MTGTVSRLSQDIIQSCKNSANQSRVMFCQFISEGKEMFVSYIEVTLFAQLDCVQIVIGND